MMSASTGAVNDVGIGQRPVVDCKTDQGVNENDKLYG